MQIDNLIPTMSTTATVHQPNTVIYCKFTTVLQANLFILLWCSIWITENLYT